MFSIWQRVKRSITSSIGVNDSLLSEGYKPLQLRVLCTLERDLNLTESPGPSIAALLAKEKYFDTSVNDKHMKVGGADGRLGFANCALPVVLPHNTPNNSVYLLWGPEQVKYPGLFPRVVRHRDF